MAGGVLLTGVLAGAVGFAAYWHAAAPEHTCATCHEIESAQKSWAQSPHRDVGCADCHGTVTSAGLHSMREKARFLSAHFGGRGTEEIRLSERQVIEVTRQCRVCHAREYADWLSGGHSATYAAIFLDPTHNAKEQLTESCLRCHGMFFARSIADLVAPLDVRGPWRLVDGNRASLPAIPCMACHLIHSRGSPAAPPDYAKPAAIAAGRGSRAANVGFYDRYERMHFEAEELAMPPLYHLRTGVRLATDPRQRVCIQCHAPNAFHEAGSSDDRTPRGVHEGLSCGACHAPHSNDAKGSCANCHPRLSNCGLAVDTMDTSYRDPASRHNIHFVACSDCHTQEFLRKHGRTTNEDRATSPAPKIQVILDTDANNELDDQHAIAYLLLSADVFDVDGISVNATRNGGDVRAQAEEAERVIKLCGLYPRIPVYLGANGSFEAIKDKVHAADFDGAQAVNYIIREAQHQPPRTLVLLPTGKLTNIALALKKAPSIAKNVRIVWLGSNYPDPGEYNQENDEAALSYILDLEVPFEIALVRYGKPSGTDAVRVTLADIERNMPGVGPRIPRPVVGRHGDQFSTFGDYSIDLFHHIRLDGDPPSRALYDMAAVAIVKNPAWATRTEIPAPILEGGVWRERPKNPRRIVIWENFQRDAIVGDFFATIRNGGRR